MRKLCALQRQRFRLRNDVAPPNDQTETKVASPIVVEFEHCCDLRSEVLVGPRTDGKILGGEISTCLME